MRSKAPLVLMEQLVMILVFALAAALCLQAFVKSDELSRRIEARDRAVTLCQSIAEVIRRNGSNFNTSAEQLGLEFGQGSTMFRYYDESWEPVPGLEGSYCLSVSGLYDTPPGLGKASVSVSEAEGDTLFEVQVAWQEEVASLA